MCRDVICSSLIHCADCRALLQCCLIFRINVFICYFSQLFVCLPMCFCCVCGLGRCDALTSEVACLTSRLGAKCAWVDGSRCMQLADALLQRSNKIVNDVIEPSCPNDCKSSLKIHAYARSTCDKFCRNQINCKSCPSPSPPPKETN